MAAQKACEPFPLIFGTLPFSSLSRGGGQQPRQKEIPTKSGSKKIFEKSECPEKNYRSP
jgi:hypothetical protein